MKRRVTITLEPETLQALDEAKGIASRSAVVGHILDLALAVSRDNGRKDEGASCLC
ncbi:ribbon-helix-helix domain-containing protein [Methanovulcanius yangii]|uniref:hypothetical protein n=1 Tax=Methanovulcanius yangii TaxID=1789227 RepID=UPI0029CA3D56|nr:hypothetical protein [Methanovulcanius yangii]